MLYGKCSNNRERPRDKWRKINIIGKEVKVYYQFVALVVLLMEMFLLCTDNFYGGAQVCASRWCAMPL